MAAKKRSKDWLKRSRAAKKGWATRKQNKQLKEKLGKQLKDTQKKLRIAQKGLPKKKRTRVKKINSTKKSIQELEDIIRRKNEEIRILEMTKNWVHAMPPEYLHPDGSIALMPSRARHLGKMTTYILRTLEKDKKKSEHKFDRSVRFFAGKLNLPVREIYTLYYSP